MSYMRRILLHFHTSFNRKRLGIYLFSTHPLKYKSEGTTAATSQLAVETAEGKSYVEPTPVGELVNQHENEVEESDKGIANQDGCMQYSDEQLQILKDQMKASITQYARDNMAVRMKKPYLDLTKSMGVTVKHTKGETKHSQLIRGCLDAEPTVEGLQNACNAYKSMNKTIRQGHIDFIATGLKFIEAYNLEQKPEVYEALMDCFPRDKFVPKNMFHTLMQVHPQMYLALDILTKMEINGLRPSQHMYDLCKEIFGKGSFTLDKIARIWFWFDELSDLNPYKLANELYLDRLDIIKAAIHRILSINDYDRQSEPKVTVKVLHISPPVQTERMINYNHFVVCGFTECQRTYIKDPSCRTMFIEGPLMTWVNHIPEQYFIMKSGQGELRATVENELSLDEEREGAVVGICFATKPYKDTLMTWLQYMQEDNPPLQSMNIVFDVPDMGFVDTTYLSPEC